MEASVRISVQRDGAPVPLMPIGMNRGVVLDSPTPRLLGEKHQVGTLDIPEHEHDHFCLHLQTAGSATLRWWWDGNQGSEKHLPGSLILLPPGTRDRLRWEGTSERYVLSLDSKYVRDVADQNECSRQPGFQTRWCFRDPGLQYVLSDIADQFSNGWPLGRLYADLLSLQLATFLLTSQTIEPFKIKTSSGGLSRNKIRACLEYLAENVHRDVSLSEVAALANLSPFHFARLFRKETGATPYGYHMDQSMQRAKYLLSTTDEFVEGVAGRVGFGNLSSFSRAFKSHEGKSPLQWRTQNRS